MPPLPYRAALLALLTLAACGEQSADAAQQGEPADCPAQVDRARRRRTDSLFEDARGLVGNCPTAMADALAAMWSVPGIHPEMARHLRAVSAILRDERLTGAIEMAVRDSARAIETRVEGLSTLSFYLRSGRWIEFTFLKDPPDSASLRMFAGSMEHPQQTESSRPIPAGYEATLRPLLGTLAGSDSSGAIRSAARRMLLFLDYLKSDTAR